LSIELKQRLVGVMVLLALAIIFLPSLFHRDEPRITVDTTTLIPPKPMVEPVVIKPAVRPINASSAPSPDKAFQPPVVEPEIAPSASVAKPAPKKEVIKPRLNDKGLPNAWVIQVGSFQSQARADELKNKLLVKYKSYTRSVNTSKGQFFRVFVGPYVDKTRVLKAQTAINKAYRVKSRVLTFAPE
jgi:DedD protein